MNDEFVISGTEFFDGCQLVVFNRWGVKVFESLDYDNSWTGEDQNGNILRSDTYYYVYICDKENTWTGWVKILTDKTD